MFILVIVNVGLFMKGIKLSDEINYYEKELKSLKQKNAEYEFKIYSEDSLTKTASIAAELGYGNYNDPIYSEVPKFAYKN